MVLGSLAGVVLAAASTVTFDPFHRVLALGWYLAPIVSSLLFLGSMKANLDSDHIQRYPNKSGRWPTLAFSAMRMLDPLFVGWLLWPTMTSTAAGENKTTVSLLLLGMVTVGAMRQAFWITCINLNEWNWELSIVVAIGNNWCDWTHAKCLLKRLAESESSDDDNNNGMIDSLTTCVGVTIFVIGSFLETHSEIQRRRFKDDPNNKGKLYTGGLFAHARHINYLGYILWRMGLGFVSAPPFTLSYGLYHAVDFYVRAIPLLQNHMQSKYGNQWTEYTKQTKSVLIPGIV